MVLPRVRGRSSVVVAIATLALGVGAGTALFSVVYAVLLRPLAIPRPDRVLAVAEASRQAPALGVSYPDFLDWQSASHDFSAMAAVRGSDMTLSGVGAPAMVIGARVSPGYFALLGARPALGRTFLAGEDKPGAPAVVVVSSRFWHQHLGAKPSWLGRPVNLDGVPRTVVGVMPPGFSALLGSAPAGQARFWTPLGTYTGPNPKLNRRGSRTAIAVLARMKPGVTLAAARADLAAVAAHLAQRYPASNAGITASAAPLLESLTGNVRPVLWGLLAATILLLLLACANVTNLLLARALAQRSEDALRAALGASPARLLRRRLGESLAVGVAGAAAGVALAALALRAAPALLPASLPRAQHIALNLPVLAFAVLLALGAALLAGLVPALGAAHVNPSAALLPRGVVGAGRGRGRSVLVACQMALALLLLAGSGLLLRSLARLQAVNPGFQPQRVLSFIIGLPETSYPSRAGQLAFFHQAEQRLRRLPGVEAAGGTFPLPFTLGGLPQPVAIPGRAQPPAGQTPTADVVNVRGGYLEAMGIRLLRGRAFSTADSASSTPVAMVDDRFAATFWPHQPLDAALGQRITVAGAARTVVGVVAHVRESGLGGALPPEAWVPQNQAQRFSNVLYFALRTKQANPLVLRTAAATAIAAIDPNVPITDVQTMDARVAATLAPRRSTLALLGAFAALALLLAAAGVYGVLSYAVARRRREIGVRMALGAGRARLLRQVLFDGLKPALAGTLAGLVAVLALGRLLAAYLVGIGSRDPLSLAAAAALLLVAAVLACLVPALRASRTDPTIALRSE